jgi:acyl-CoA dehydrogenase
MEFELAEEHRLLKELVARFVRDELMGLESVVMARDAAGQGCYLTQDERAPIDVRARQLGLWGLDAPEDVGGSDLPQVAMVGVKEEIGRTVTPYVLAPDSPNLRMLAACVSDDQRQRYLEPYVRGATISAIGISEPGAGADPAGMTTSARRDGDDYILNGRKIWISRAAEADFTILMAVTDKAKGSRGGITGFLIDRDTPGFKVLRKIPMIGGQTTYEVALEDCRVHKRQVLGVEGDGFGPMQLRLSTRRLEMAAWCVGISQRALEMMSDFAPTRHTFGAPLSQRQTVQWWVADAATKIHAARLMVYDAAWKIDQGRDVRREISMAKVFATEMAWEILDHAMQCFGAMGMTKELPLSLMAQQVRTMRIYDGPSEVHRMVIARGLMNTK